MFAWWLETIKHVWWPNILSFGHLVRCCLMVFSAVWSCLLEFEIHQTSDQTASFKHSYCSRVWCAVFSSFGRLHQTCLAHACAPLTIHPPWLLGACLMASLIYFWPRHQTGGKFYMITQLRSQGDVLEARLHGLIRTQRLSGIWFMHDNGEMSVQPTRDS